MIDTNEVSAKLSFADAVLALVKEHKLGPKRRPRRALRARKAKSAKAPAAVSTERKPRRSRPKPLPMDAGEE
jgi:hypothetical protein